MTHSKYSPFKDTEAKQQVQPDLASALAKVTKEQNWSQHPNPVRSPL